MGWEGGREGAVLQWRLPLCWLPHDRSQGCHLPSKAPRARRRLRRRANHRCRCCSSQGQQGQQLEQGMVLDGWVWDTSTRVALLVVALVVLSNCGGDLIAWSCKEKSGNGEGGGGVGGGGGGGERKQVLATITGHCLPKLVCQLHALQSREHISESERNLISLVSGSSGLTGTPSKYSFAAHMGRLVRGVEGTGCHNFYPDCPFSNQDVLQIARRINFK